MPRKYDRVIRYYASWFDDLLDPAKEFTAEEFKLVFLAIRDAQLEGSLRPLDELPVSIRRALSMATMGEQIVRLLEKAERMRERGSRGGRATAQREKTPDEIAMQSLKKELDDAAILAADIKYQDQKRKAAKPAAYIDTLRKAATGDMAACQELRIDQEQAIEIAKRKGVLL